MGKAHIHKVVVAINNYCNAERANGDESFMNKYDADWPTLELTLPCYRYCRLAILKTCPPYVHLLRPLSAYANANPNRYRLLEPTFFPFFAS